MVHPGIKESLPCKLQALALLLPSFTSQKCVVITIMMVILALCLIISLGYLVYCCSPNA